MRAAADRLCVRLALFWSCQFQERKRTLVVLPILAGNVRDSHSAWIMLFRTVNFVMVEATRKSGATNIRTRMSFCTVLSSYLHCTVTILSLILLVL